MKLIITVELRNIKSIFHSLMSVSTLFKREKDEDVGKLSVLIISTVS